VPDHLAERGRPAHAARRSRHGRERAAGPYPYLAAAGGCLLIAAGVLAAGHRTEPVSSGVVPTAAPTPSGARSPTVAERSGPTAAVADLVRDSPSRPGPTALRLPALGVDAQVGPVAELPDGSLAVPSNPHVLGWWYHSAAPGDPAGTVVVIGHVDTARDGAGALFRLSTARPGQHIVLDTPHGQHHYVVAATRGYPKAHLPTRDIFATGGRPRLVLITCGGAFDPHTRQYADNIVVYATPDRHPAPRPADAPRPGPGPGR
jgi:hypothetical protein